MSDKLSHGSARAGPLETQLSALTGLSGGWAAASPATSSQTRSQSSRADRAERAARWRGGGGGGGGGGGQPSTAEAAVDVDIKSPLEKPIVPSAMRDPKVDDPDEVGGFLSSLANGW